MFENNKKVSNEIFLVIIAYCHFAQFLYKKNLKSKYIGQKLVEDINIEKFK